MPMILLAEGGVHYELAGPLDGALVVLMHGGMVPMWTWDAQVPALVAKGFRVLRYDMFGKGQSDMPPGDYGRGFFCRQLLGLLDALGFEQPIHLVGHGLGAGIAAHFCAEHPERVESLALVAPVLDFGERAGLVKLARLPLLGGLLVRLLMPRRATDRVAGLWSGLPRAPQYAALFAQQMARPGFMRAFTALLRSDALRDYSADYRTLGDTSRGGLLVWGSADEDTPRMHIQQIGRLAPLLQSHELQGAGHGIPFQRAEVLNALLAEHLTGHAGDAYASTELAGLR